MIYIINKEKYNKLKKINNYFVITDFDRTLTTAESEPTMGIIPQYLGGECLEKRTKIYEQYRPLELDYTIEENKKQQAQAPAEDISSQNLSTEQLFAMGGQLTW